MADDPYASFASPVSGGDPYASFSSPAASAQSGPPQKKDLLGQMGDDFMSTVGGAVDKVKQDFAPATRAYGDLISHPSVDTYVNAVKSGAMAAINPLNKVDAVGAAFSPVSGALKAAARPIGNAVGGVASDMGLPSVTPGTGVQDLPGIAQQLYQQLVQGQKATRQQSQDNATGAVANLIGGLGGMGAEEAPAMSRPPLKNAAPDAGVGLPAIRTQDGPPMLGPAPAATGDQIAAGRTLAQQMKAAKVSPAQAFDPSTGLTPAENIGPGAENMLSAIGRRPGDTGSALNELAANRVGNLPGQFDDIASNVMGLPGTAVDGAVSDITKAAQARAKPLYDEFEQLGPIGSDKMDGLLQTPYVRGALKDALTNARNEQLPETDIQHIQQLIDGLPTDDGPQGDPNDFLEPAREYLQSRNVGAALRRARGPSLTDWLAKSGGLTDPGGDIAALDGHLNHINRPFMNRLINPAGRGLDDASQAAWEHGYFPHHSQAPAVPDFVDAIRRDMGGDKFYAGSTGEAGALADRTDAFERLMAHHEIDPTGKSAGQIAGELADKDAQARSYEDLLNNGTASTEPATEASTRQSYKPRVLYDIKKVLDDDYILRKNKADANGAHPLDRPKNIAYGRFKEELANLVNNKGFNYDHMVAAGGDAPKIQEALRSGKYLIENNGTRQLKAKTLTMSPVEKKAALGGFIRDTLNSTDAAQRLTPKKLLQYGSDDFAARVSHMAGDPAAGARWQAQIRNLAKGQRGVRLAPDFNSVTSGISQGNKDLDAAGYADIDLVKAATKPKQAIAEFALGQARKISDRYTTAWTAEKRNALGAALSDVDQGRAAYQAYNATRMQRGLPPITRKAFGAISAQNATPSRSGPPQKKP